MGGSHVYGAITVSPLVEIPVSKIVLNTLKTQQTKSDGTVVTTDILNDPTTTYSYKGNYVADSKPGQFNFEFDLESLHFFVSVAGTPCAIIGEIEITYKDGSTVRRG